MRDASLSGESNVELTMVEVGVPTHEVRFTVLGRAAQAVYPALIGPLLIVMSLLEPALLADWIYLGLGGGLLLTCLGIRALRSGVAVRHGQVECRRVWSTLRVPLAQVANLEVSTCPPFGCPPRSLKPTVSWLSLGTDAALRARQFSEDAAMLNEQSRF